MEPFFGLLQNLFARKMKNNFRWLVLLAAIVSAGCAAWKRSPAAAPPVSTAVVTPDLSLTAKVVSVNTVGRFVVMTFPSGQLPKLQSTVFLYRAGVKVAEVKITGPQDGDNTVGDVISGEANAGDNVRDQ
jgi:hypothetical protein